jgi:hypothetical protein
MLEVTGVFDAAAGKGFSGFAICSCRCSLERLAGPI